jgi:hypothetical protein
MNGHVTPYAGRLHRKLREVWPDRNPLRRRWDRFETVVFGGLLAAFLVCGTLAALATGRWAYEDALHARHAELASWHEVPAVLLTAALKSPGGYAASAKASWQAPGGVRHTSVVSAPPAAAAGTTVRVWVDASGRLAGSPLLLPQVQGRAELAGMLAVMVVAAVLWGAGLAAHRVADRRRMVAWDEDWRATGPKWSRHG